MITTTAQPPTMHAAAIDAFGQPLTPRLLPIPSVAPDEILIRVESAGVGVWDPFEQQGGFAKMTGTPAHFPYVIGSDGAGTVVEVGAKVRRFKPGDSVYAFAFMNPKGGFYAEFAAVKEELASPIPGGLTIEQAGALPVDGVTALEGLGNALHLKPGESILIFGASGGIGHLAVQLAKRMGARVLAVASGPDGVEMVKGLNAADAVVDGHAQNLLQAARKFAPNGLDTALLTAGGNTANELLKTLHPAGRVAYPHGVEPEPQPPAGIQAIAYDGRPNPEIIAKLNHLIEQSPSFQVHIDRSFPLDQAPTALGALERHFLGKLALHPAY